MAVRKEIYDIDLLSGCTPYNDISGKYAEPKSTYYYNDNTSVSRVAVFAELKGLIKVPANLAKGTVIGYNPNPPKGAMAFPCVTNGGFVRVQLETNGNIRLEAGTAVDYIFLDGVVYDTGAEVAENE